MYILYVYIYKIYIYDNVRVKTIPIPISHCLKLLNFSKSNSALYFIWQYQFTLFIIMRRIFIMS